MFLVSFFLSSFSPFTNLAEWEECFLTSLLEIGFDVEMRLVNANSEIIPFEEGRRSPIVVVLSEKKKITDVLKTF